MYVRVNQDRCAGCGICMYECPSGAIQMENGWAVIDHSRCTGCQTCVEVCPNEAIEVVNQQPGAAVMPNQQTNSTLATQETKTVVIPHKSDIIQPQAEKNRLSIAPVASAAMAYVGREVVPRVIDAMVTALENRLARTADHNQISIEPPQNRPLNYGRGGRGKQIRYRGGRGNVKFRKGRR